MQRPVIVQKYGGSSVSTTQAIQIVAKRIAERQREGYSLCVVVSAMGKTTDQLLKQAHEVCENPSRRELDMLLSCGERASMALLAMALHELGVSSISLTGSQSGIITDDVHSGAKIIEVRPSRVLDALSEDKVVIIAGFQGVSIRREITTLGRGGSDTTAVAMAAALNAELCEIYSDVEGVFTADPRLVPDAQLLAKIDFDSMLELSHAGAKVLNAQAVAFAKAKGIEIVARKTNDAAPGTLISAEKIQEAKDLVAIAHKPIVHRMIGRVEEIAKLSGQFENFGMNPALISCSGSEATYLFFPEDAHDLENFSRKNESLVTILSDVGLVTLVGLGCSPSSYLLNEALAVFEGAGIKIFGTSLASTRVSFWMDPQHVKLALRNIHLRFVSPNLGMGAIESVNA